MRLYEEDTMSSSDRILGLSLVPRIALAAVLLGAGAAVLAKQWLPHKPLLQSWLQVGLGVGTVVLCLIVATLITLSLMQWMLRHGGIDTQWLWFSSDPPGLERPRR